MVTNVEADHLDHYGSRQAYRAAFEDFLDRIGPAAPWSTCADDPGAAALADRARAARHAGCAATAADAGRRACCIDFRPDGAGARIVLVHAGVERPAAARVPGEHMALNALAALLAGVELGATPATAGRAGRVRRGAAAVRVPRPGGRGGGVRRLRPPPQQGGGQLRAAREVAGRGRVVVAFQPHLYSRTREFAGEFGAALGLADEVVVLEVYGAREDPEPGVSGALVADAVPLPAERVHYVPRWAEVPAVVAGVARPATW